MFVINTKEKTFVYTLLQFIINIYLYKCSNVYWKLLQTDWHTKVCYEWRNSFHVLKKFIFSRPRRKRNSINTFKWYKWTECINPFIIYKSQLFCRQRFFISYLTFYIISKQMNLILIASYCDIFNKTVFCEVDITSEGRLNNLKPVCQVEKNNQSSLNIRFIIKLD